MGVNRARIMDHCATGQRAAAAEILNRVREEVATRNAMHARGA